MGKKLASLRGFVPLAIWGEGLLAVAAFGLAVVVLLAWPGGILDKADHAAYAVCHRIGERSFYIAGRQLPLCARCSGTYLGTLAGLVVLTARGRGRTRSLPAGGPLVVLAVFFMAWAVDGANSYLTLFPGLPHLYEPHNLLRLATGAFEGLCISVLLLPAFNLTVWEPASPGPSSISGWTDLAWLCAGGAFVVALVATQWAPLLYPLALLSGTLVVGLIGVINGMVLLTLTRRGGRSRRWRDVAAPLVGGLALAALELTAIGLLRAELTSWLGLPF